MKFWQALTWMEPEQMLEVARFAEAVGFDGVMLGDHGVYPRDVLSRYPYSADGKPPMTADSYYPDCWASIGAMGGSSSRTCPSGTSSTIGAMGGGSSRAGADVPFDNWVPHTQNVSA